MADRANPLSSWVLYKALAAGRLQPETKAYYFDGGRQRPRDSLGFPVLPANAPQAALDYAKAHGFPLPGETA